MLLGAAAGMLLAAPVFMPASYSWIAHTTSESAAQGIDHAWIARTGLALMAAGVMTVTWSARSEWNTLTLIAHTAFALSMAGAAVFSAAPWFDAAFERTEDMLHSVFAGAMGVAFAIGVVSSIFDDHGDRRRVRAVDVAAVVASVAVPLAMFNLAVVAGVLQRIMFAIAFWWYGVAGSHHVRSSRLPVSPV